MQGQSIDKTQDMLKGKGVTVYITDETRLFIERYLRGLKPAVSLSHFVRVAVENQIKELEKSRSYYRLVETEDGYTLMELSVVCPLCGISTVQYCQLPQESKKEKEKIHKTLKELFNKKKTDMFNGE